MADVALTPQQFEEADGTGQWRALNAGADAWFDAPSHRAGAALVRRVGEVADVSGHHPDSARVSSLSRRWPVWQMMAGLPD